MAVRAESGRLGGKVAGGGGRPLRASLALLATSTGSRGKRHNLISSHTCIRGSAKCCNRSFAQHPGGCGSPAYYDRAVPVAFPGGFDQRRRETGLSPIDYVLRCGRTFATPYAPSPSPPDLPPWRSSPSPWDRPQQHGVQHCGCGLLLRPLPVSNPDHVVMIWETQRPGAATGDLGLRPRLSGLETRVAVLPGDGDGQRLRRIWFQPDYRRRARAGPGRPRQHRLPEGLGRRSRFGPRFHPGRGPAGGPKVALISYQLWQRRFGADPAIIGTRNRAGRHQPYHHWSDAGRLAFLRQRGCLHSAGSRPGAESARLPSVRYHRATEARLTPPRRKPNWMASRGGWSSATPIPTVTSAHW